MHSATIGSAGVPAGLAVEGHRPQPPGARLLVPVALPGRVGTCRPWGRCRPAVPLCCRPPRPRPARKAPPSTSPGRAGRAAPAPSSRSAPGTDRSPDHTAPQPRQILLAGPRQPLPHRGAPAMAGRGQGTQHHRQQAIQPIHAASSRPRVTHRLKLRPRPGRQTRTVDTTSDHTGRNTRQYRCGHATPRSGRPQRPS